MAKIIGSAPCPACSLSGHDADSCRANELEGGSIMCINCGSFTKAIERKTLDELRELPSAIRQVAATLLRSRNFAVPGLTLSFIGKGQSDIISPDRAAAAVAQGAVDYLVDLSHEWTIGFKGASPIDTLIIKYDERGASALGEGDCRRLVYGGMNTGEMGVDAQEIERKLISALCPVDLAAGVARLVQAGFTVPSCTLDGLLRKANLRFNPESGQKSGPSQTIRAEVSFYLSR